jgi:putative ABC transport system ATP-binding protein
MTDGTLSTRLKISDLSFSYQLHSESSKSMDKILHETSFEVHQRQSLAISGKSGQGKSTLISLLAGLERPSQGEIFDEVKNVSITTMTWRQLSLWRAQNIGLVFQNYYLIESLTALENILLVCQVQNIASAKERSWEMLKKVGLDHRAHHYPRQLSGGECQRVAIARAIVHEPSIVLADEPSGNLDEETGNSVMDLIFSLVKERGISLVLVTHDLVLAQKCQRHLVLKNKSLSPYL